MKYLKLNLVVLLCLVLASCQPRYTHNDIILRAESLLNSKPDSAQKLLVSIAHPEKLPAADYAAWCLQYTHAQYKLYQDIKSDSIIRKAVKYYDNSKLYKQSGTAYYLLGCILQLNNKNKAAMWAYKKADEILKHTNEHDLIGLVEFKIGYIYMLDYIYVQALIYYKKSIKHFVLTKNVNYQAYAYREISDMYVQLHYPFNSVMSNSNLALKLSKLAGDSNNYYSTLGQQGEMLLYRDYNRSKESLLKSYHYHNSYKSNYAPYLSLVYSKLNKPDSARYYQKVSQTETSDKDIKMITLIAGAYIALNAENPEQAFRSLENAYNLRDTIFQQTITSQLYRIDKQYDLTQKEKENATLKITNQHNTILILVMAIGMMILIFIMYVMFTRHKKKLLKTDMINQLKQQSIEYDLKLKQTENEQQKQMLLTKLQGRIKNTLFFNRLKMGNTQEDKKDEFMKKIIDQSVLTESDWQFYINEVDHIFDKQITALKATYPDLSQLDLIVISLIFLQLDISDTCVLLNMTKATMYKRRNRIKERIGLEQETDLEEWLLQNVAGINVPEEHKIMN